MLAPSPVAHSVDSLSEPCTAFDSVARFLCTDAAVLKGLTWRRVAYTCLVAAGFALWTASGNWMRWRYGAKPSSIGIAEFFVHDRWGYLPVFRVYLALFFAQMLALTVADNLRISRVPRTVWLSIALVLGTTLGSVVVMTTGSYLDWPPAWGLTWGGLIAFVYFKRRRDEELAVALHTVQLTRMELQKKTLESNLQLAQARVEPKFLFNTLRRVGDFYATDRALGDRMLDNLIIYLRAALPQMRTTTSTLGQEVQLAQAYLDIEGIHAQGRLDFAVGIPHRLRSAAFPPMVLLPLIEACMRRDRNETGDGDILRAEACADAGRLKLILNAMHPRDARPATDEIERIRGRVAALFGAEGTLRLEPLDPHGTVATLELPHVPT